MAGGGIGEAMLIGAAMGGGSAALTGGDPLKGALLGGLTGGAGAGIGVALGGAAGGAEGALSSTLGSQVGTEAATQAGTQAATQATQAAAFQPGMTAQGLTTANAGAFNSAMGAGQGLSTTGGSVGALNSGMAPSAIQGGTNFGLNAPSIAPGSTYALGAPSIAPGGGGIANLATAAPAAPATGGTFTEGMQRFANNPIASIKANPFTAGASALAGAVGARRDFQPPDTSYNGPLSRFKFNPDTYRSAFAEGGITSLAAGGYDRMIGEQPDYPSNMAHGGIADLGSYSDGGRMLRGPGDGMSDSIPGVIGGKRPARLADGEFVVPADVVSHLGNGSTDAGAKHLYSMMDKVRAARTGRKVQGREINANRYVPGTKAQNRELNSNQYVPA
jgi:hypothetical protein